MLLAFVEDIALGVFKMRGEMAEKGTAPIADIKQRVGEAIKVRACSL